MTLAKNGYASSVHNVMLILRNDPAWQDVLCYDAFAQRVVFLKPPPYPPEFREQDITVKHDPHAHAARNTKRFLGTEVKDHDLTLTAAWIEREYKPIKPSAAMCGEALEAMARTNKHHPVRDMVKAVPWDGVERIGRVADPNKEGDKGAKSWLATFFGADDDDYTRRVGRWWLISAIARIMKPGCQADYALILEGKQGAGKSAGLRALSEPWFSEDMGDISSKESQQQLAGVWIVEIAELDAFNKSSDAAIKKFLSQPFDRYRPPYGRRPQDFPRQCVFAATTNKRSYLRDVTGNRRYWPVWTTTADVDGIREWRAQIWAEALVLYNAGELWWPQKDDNDLLAERQDDRMEVDPWLDSVALWVDAREQNGVKRFAVGDVLNALKIDQARWGALEDKRVGKIMSLLGFVRVRRKLGSVMTYAYERPADYAPEPSTPPQGPAAPPAPAAPAAPPAPPPQAIFTFEQPQPPYDFDDGEDFPR